MIPRSNEAATIAVAANAQAPTGAAQKPNILVIMSDDVGWSNISAYGGDIMGVPTVLLATSGV